MIRLNRHSTITLTQELNKLKPGRGDTMKKGKSEDLPFGSVESHFFPCCAIDKVKLNNYIVPFREKT
jgi:hypothetical protein